MEYLIQGIQLLIMQGVNSRVEYEYLYGASSEQISQALHEINIRYQASGGSMDVKPLRAEMLDRLNYAERNLWNDYHSAPESAKTKIFGNWLKLTEHRMMISGLSKESIEMILEVKGDHGIMQRMKNQDGMLTTFTRLCDMIEDVQTRELRQALQGNRPVQEAVLVDNLAE
ncbi:MAG: hypothetical protein ABW007_18940 [Chitinophagaceae bacterium]